MLDMLVVCLSTIYEITGLVSSTNYSIMASFTDGCGSISAMIVAATLPSTGEFNAHFT